MNFRTTGVLVLLLLVAGSIWLFAPRGAEEADGEPETPTPQSETILDPAPEAEKLVRFTLERADEPTLVFSREPKADGTGMTDWKLVEPQPLPIENFMVNSLVTTFTRLQARSSLEIGGAGGVDLKTAGLEPPVARVMMASEDGEEYVLEIGKHAAMSNDTYVYVPDSKKIFVAKRDLESQIERDLEEYRRKKLFADAFKDAVSLRIEHEGMAYAFSRQPGGDWVMDEPTKAPAKTAEIAKVVSRLAALRAAEFVEDEPESLVPFGLDAPFLRATVVTKAKEPIETPAKDEPSETQPAEPQFRTVEKTYGVVVGNFAGLQQEQRFAKRADAPWVVALKTSDIDPLLPDPVQWRDPGVTRVKAADVSELALTIGGEAVTLTKDEGGWTGTGDVTEVDTAAVVDMLEAFEDLKAIDFIDKPQTLERYGLAEPRATVRVTARGQVDPVALQIGANTASGRNTYVKRGGDETIYVVAAAQAERLAVPPIALRSRQIYQCANANVRRLEIERGRQTYVLERVENAWRMTEPSEAPRDPEGVQTLVNDLCRLRAAAVVGKGDFARYGLETPTIVLRVGVLKPIDGPVPEEPELDEHVLHFAQTADGAFCRVEQQPFVFQIDKSVYEVFAAELIDRDLFDFDADAVLGVSIVGPGGTLDLDRGDEGWTFLPDPYVTLSQSKVETFVESLANMRVESYLAYSGADFAQYGLRDAPVTVTIRLEEGGSVTLKLTPGRGDDLPRLAGWAERQRVFRMRVADVEKILRGLDYYVKAAGSEDETE